MFRESSKTSKWYRKSNNFFLKHKFLYFLILLQVFTLAESLGGFESLAELP